LPPPIGNRHPARTQAYCERERIDTAGRDRRDDWALAARLQPARVG
jgi:hypothetical protein